LSLCHIHRKGKSQQETSIAFKFFITHQLFLIYFYTAISRRLPQPKVNVYINKWADRHIGGWRFNQPKHS
jgi:hypothetical protein